MLEYRNFAPLGIFPPTQERHSLLLFVKRCWEMHSGLQSAEASEDTVLAFSTIDGIPLPLAQLDSLSVVIHPK